MKRQFSYLLTRVTVHAMLLGCFLLTPPSAIAVEIPFKLGCPYVWCMPSDDQPALQIAVNIAKDHIERYSDYMCIGASIDLANALNNEVTKTDSALFGWIVTIVNGRGDVDVGGRGSHNGVRLKSPVTGDNYYIDSFTLTTLCNMDVLEINGDGEEIKWKARGCFTASGSYVPDDLIEAFCDLPERQKQKFLAKVNSFDPNDKVGSQGAGEQRFLSGEVPLRYIVNFENHETATAPAQEVLITDKIQADFDIKTVNLGSISFGKTHVAPPSGTQTYSEDVVVPGQILESLIVRITASVNTSTRAVTWRLSAIDPLTGNPPNDPREGFLPPNINPPEGDGSVLLTVKPKVDLPTGTEIRNVASIVFDTNTPIVTPEWLNTLDNDKPNSAVSQLDTTQSSTSFTVQWTGADVGAGIKDYTIWVSESGGTYVPWLTNTVDSSAIFSGVNGTTYGFYSTTRDQTGNTEAAPTIADTSTTISVPVLRGDFDGDGCVSKADYDILMADIRNSEPMSPDYDLNEDGVVNRADARTLVGLFTNPRGSACY